MAESFFSRWSKVIEKIPLAKAPPMTFIEAIERIVQGGFVSRKIHKEWTYGLNEQVLCSHHPKRGWLRGVAFSKTCLEADDWFVKPHEDRP